MSPIILLLQLIVPSVLIAWLAKKPAASAIMYVIQSCSTGVVILAIALSTIWLLPPWWMPYLYGFAWFAVVLNQVVRLALRSQGIDQNSSTQSIGMIALSVLGVFAVYICAQALLGRQLPTVDVVDISSPFAGGTFLVAHGGSREIVNAHMKTLDARIERFRIFRGQSYAVDLIKVNRLGFRADGWLPQDPSRYETYGERVYSPCNGEVLSSRNDRPDMPVPVMDLNYFYGNHLFLSCGEFGVLLTHFRQGTVQYQIGDVVQIGDLLGEVGNSGRTTEPHLHINAQRLGQPETPLVGEPIAITINGHFPFRNQLLRIAN